ncbi:uncharacterized protein RCC_11014 [Ramularia collo-cygni]|uniref:Uncharacterized protein n=1 Tax=Ramularia collo-cygni TaxID=112498 RepID=A0A2D3V783_9PEZI|nr:uncharacterized protein RCC_11014 [Ramularia collo-cygni]CZT25286.1 uncharacterized protein RCC_11014 [Ramularia collo-cygni]
MAFTPLLESNISTAFPTIQAPPLGSRQPTRRSRYPLDSTDGQNTSSYDHGSLPCGGDPHIGHNVFWGTTKFLVSMEVFVAILVVGTMSFLETRI